MSERVERRLMALLDEPRYSPYGTPIPGMDAIGGPQVGDERFKGMNLLDAATQDREATFTVRLLPEVIQADQELIETLSSAGVLNGARVKVAPSETDEQRVLVTVTDTGHGVDLDRVSAKAIRVDLNQDRV